jgi:prolyl-tRNA editing enzyme YbaK/EbsC (Cys-tRNA(Pro) deacylase)
MPVDFSRFAAVLRDLGVSGEVRERPESAPTAAAAAAQLGCEVGAIANSLVFSADGAPLLVMTSGAHRVDTWLEKYDVIWAAAGRPHTVFPTSFAELVRITDGTPAEVGE